MYCASPSADDIWSSFAFFQYAAHQRSCAATSLCDEAVASDASRVAAVAAPSPPFQDGVATTTL